MPKPPDNRPYILWYIKNQELKIVGIARAKSKSGAVAKFSNEAGMSKEEFSAEKIMLTNNCSIVDTSF